VKSQLLVDFESVEGVISIKEWSIEERDNNDITVE
jgi:hypothetical protein